MNWKQVFKLTRTKALGFIIPFSLVQIYLIWKISNPMCVGACAAEVYTLASKVQAWFLASLWEVIILTTLIIIVSIIYQLKKK